jgi:hypothetical protein
MNTPAGGLGPLPATLLVTGVAEAFVMNPVQPGSPLQVQIPPSTMLDGQRFLLDASGTVSVPGGAAATLKLYLQTPGGNVLLGSGAGPASGDAVQSWWIHAELQFSSKAQKFQGFVEFLVENTPTAKTPIANQGTGILNSNSPVAGFVMSATFGAANPNNQITVREFAIGF